MVMKFINKVTPILKPVMEDFLFFLVKSYFEPVLSNVGEVDYKVDLCNICCKLCQINMEVEVALK